MTTVHADTQALHVAALTKIVADDAAFDRLMADDSKVDEIYESKPYLVRILENAITARDDAKFEIEEAHAAACKARESQAAYAAEEDFLSGFLPEDDEPERGNFGMRMAAIRKAKNAGKGKKPAAKPAKKRVEQSESKAFTFRAKHYKAHSVCKIVRGKEKGTSSNTTAFERITAEGDVFDRVIVGSTQAEIILSIPEVERVKMLASLQR